MDSGITGPIGAIQAGERSLSENAKAVISRATIANVVSGFVVVAGVIMTIYQIELSELLIGSALGYLFGKNVKI